MRMLLAVLAVLACGCLAPRKTASTLQKAVAMANASDGAIASDGVDAAPLDDATDEDLALPTDGADAADAVGEPDVADAKTGASPDADIGPSPCPTACDDGNPCTDDGCNAAAVCTHAPNAAKCNDGNVCTTGDVCKAGACASGPPKDCSDGDACTTDTCSGDGCASTPTDCDDKNPCTDDACDKASGCKHTPKTGGCDDGLACTTDACDAKSGGCAHVPVANCACGKDADCDDGQPCTLDACNAKVCAHAAKPDGAACDDGNACTSGDVCNSGICLAKAAVNCDDGNVCTDDACNPANGTCSHSGNAAACDDGNTCTVADSCVGGACKGAAAKDGTACDDASKCTAFDACSAGACVGKAIEVVATCDDGAACTDDACEPAKGCVHLARLFDAVYPDVGAGGRFTAIAKVGDGFVASGLTALNSSTNAPLLMRLDAHGGIVWQATYSTPFNHGARAMAVLPAGFALAGFTEMAGGGSGVWLARTDANGKLLWEKPMQPKAMLTWDAAALAVMADGGFVLFGNGGNVTHLVRTDASGDLQWAKVFGDLKPGGMSYASAVAVVADGVVAAGVTSTLSEPSNEMRTWLLHTDTQGTLLWQKSYPGSTQFAGSIGLAVLPDGYALAGTETLPGNLQRPHLVRTDLQGNLLWSREFDAKFNANGVQAIVALPDGFALAGRVTAGTSGDSDLLMMRTDLNGNLLWNQTHGGPGMDDAFAMVALPDGFALVGMSAEKLGVDADPWLIRTDPWGHASCADAGVCFSTPPATCDDANACTADLCDAAKGCTHDKLTDSTPCGEGLACSNGKCVANAVGCVQDGAACGDGKGTCSNGHCFWTDAKGYKWTLVPAGKFYMGCNAAVDNGCTEAEKPQHEVILSAYWIGVYEVTVANYKACVDAGVAGCTLPVSSNPGDLNWGVPGKEQHPVNNVDFMQSQAYCKWLGADVPTEAQWEKAARGGCEQYPGKVCATSEPKYPWGNADPKCGQQAVFNAAGSGTSAGCDTASTYAVGTGAVQGQSPYGLFDMAGNVWEWTQDWFDPGFYAKPAAATMDPVNAGAWGPAGIVCRGGSFYYVSNGQSVPALRASFRSGYGQSYHLNDIGIRCARPYP